MNTKFLKELSEARGVPGQEQNLRKIVRRELKGLVDDMNVDVMGNLICRKKGSGRSPKKVMIAAHMDEIGFIVKHIDDRGFLRLQPLGGFDPRQLFSQRMLIDRVAGKPLKGVLCYAAKPIHLQRGSGNDSKPNLNGFFVDLGMSAAKVRKQVEIGAMVTLDRTFELVGDSVVGKSLDNRIGVFVMIEAVKKAKKHKVEILAVATTQEEIGCRGAATSAFSLEPDIGIALDITLACDIPGMSPQDHISKLGGGAAIKLMDSSLLGHPKVVSHFKTLAKANKIKHQMEILPFGGTDGCAIQRSRSGVPSMTLSVPCRYVHTVNEMCNKADIQAAIDLLAAYLEDAHTAKYDLV